MGIRYLDSHAPICFQLTQQTIWDKHPTCSICIQTTIQTLSTLILRGSFNIRLQLNYSASKVFNLAPSACLYLYESISVHIYSVLSVSKTCKTPSLCNKWRLHCSNNLVGLYRTLTMLLMLRINDESCRWFTERAKSRFIKQPQVILTRCTFIHHVTGWSNYEGKQLTFVLQLCKKHDFWGVKGKLKNSLSVSDYLDTDNNFIL